MCRLFGFRSVIQSQVHRSLLAADNALAVQSQTHSDGWGVGYYVADSPHIIKSVQPANQDHIFERVSGIVASQTVLAHLRKATTGDVNILNSHPFQYSQWIFAHNGQVSNFKTVREQLKAEVAPNLRRFILGDTDSEVIFYLVLTHLAQLTDIHRQGTPIEHLVEAIARVVTRVVALSDPEDTDDPDALTRLSFIMTDGATMVAFKRIKELLFSTYKTRCLDRNDCPFLAACCEAPTETGFVNHLIVSSEPLQGDNTWIPMQDFDVIGVDWRMSLHKGHIHPDGSYDLTANYKQSESEVLPVSEVQAALKDTA